MKPSRMKTLFTLVESPFSPHFPELYQELGIDAERFDSARNLHRALQKQAPDFFVGEFVYGWGNDYAGNTVSNLDVTLRTLQSKAPGAKVIVVANHFNSKGGDQPLYSRFQPPNRVTEVQRLLQAQEVRNFVDDLQEIAPRANIVVLGGTAAVKRKISLRSSDKAGAFASASISYPDLAEMLEVDRVVPVRARYQTGANTRGQVAGLVAYTYFAQDGATKDDPSNLKRFTTMTPSGQYRVYIESILKRTKISVEHYSRTIITSALGIRKLVPTFTNA